MAKILIIDDDPSIRDNLKSLLVLGGYEVFAASNGSEGLKVFHDNHPEIIVLDIKMPGISGIDVLKKIKTESKETEVIMITGHGGLDTAIEAMKEGAFHYIQKPIEFQELEITITKALEKQKMQKRLETQRHQLAMLSQAIEQSPSIVMITDFNGKIEYVNPKFTHVTGYTIDEVKGKNPRFLKSGDLHQEEYKRLWETITSGGEWRGKFLNKKKNGELYWEDASISPVKNPEGLITHFMAIKEDITERKLAEETVVSQQKQLIQADKMASLGTMAAGVAHEINNPLNVAIGDIHLFGRDFKALLEFIDLFSKGPLPPKEIERQKNDMDIPYIIENVDNKLSRCKGAMERIKNIVNQLRVFSRIDTGGLIDVDINKSIENAIQMIPEKYKHSIEVKEKYGLLPQIPCFGGEINQVFINIIINAFQAIKGEGELKIKTLSDDKYVYAKFCDTGQGIKENKMKAIFDPFFTTKPIGEGTGLGLSISYSIIEKHGGDITVVNNVDKGVTFTVKLPKAGIKIGSKS